MTDDARVHQSTWALLPWLANGRASPEERERAEAHLRECAACRAELAREQHLADALAQPATPAPEVEAGLQRLMRRLDQADAAPPPGRWWPWAGARLGLGTVAVLGLAEFVLIGGVALWWAAGGTTPGPVDAAPYRTLTQPQTSPVTAPQWRVVFQDRTSLEQLQRLLHEHRLTIVAGPSDAGVFTLGAAAPQAQAQADALAARLRASPLVRFAEAVPERGQP